MIHVIDDDRKLRATLWRFLLNEGHAVKRHASGVNVIDLLEDGDVVLTDLRTPHNGHALIDELHCRGMLTPVIVIAGQPARVYESLRHNDLIVMILTKPIGVDDVRVAIDKALKRGDLIRELYREIPDFVQQIARQAS